MKKSVCTALLAMALSGCSYNATVEQPASNGASNQPIPSSLAGNAKVASVDNHWLLASESRGFQIIRPNNTQALHPGRHELLDTRTFAGGTVAVSYDIENNRPVAVYIDDHGFKSSPLNSPEFQIDGLCLQYIADNQLYLWLLDGDGRAEQWWLKSGEDNAFSSHYVKQLSVPPEASQCAASDHSEMLLLVEEGFGVWAYPAHPEADFQRRLLAAVAPWDGRLNSPVDIAALPGGFAVLDHRNTGASITYFQWQGDSAEQLKTVKLPKVGQATTLSIALDDGQSTAWVYDEESGRFTESRFPWTRQVDPVAALPSVQPSMETDPMPGLGDVADDPAIWVHPEDGSKSLILGTNKKGGIAVYNLNGDQQQFHATGHINNVDVRSVNITYNQRPVDIAAATNRSDNSIAIYTIDRQSGQLQNAGKIDTPLPEIYGFCLYQSPLDQSLYAFANDKDGTFVQYLVDLEQPMPDQPVRRFSVSSQPEGCVADDRSQRLFVGEENRAVWQIGAEPDADTTLTSVLETGGSLTADIEGLALYQNGDQTLLIISSQGSDSYLIIEAESPWRELGHFRIGINPLLDIDGASETDGLEATSQGLGPNLPKGALVVQDGRNVMPMQPQNFKLVPWEEVEALLNSNHSGE